MVVGCADRERVGEQGERSEPRPATREISGRVREENDAPIERARVCAWPSVREGLGYRSRSPSCTRTDREGEYRLEIDHSGPVVVSAGAVGFIPAAWSTRTEYQFIDEVHTQAGSPRTNIDLSLTPGGVACRGVVRGIDGIPLAGALVAGRRLDAGRRRGEGLGARHVTTSDEKGRFEIWLAPAHSVLEVLATNHVLAAVELDDPSVGTDVYLAPGATISGTVVDAEGRGLPNVEIRTFSSLGGVSKSAVWSDAQGRFEVPELPPGRFEVTAIAQNGVGKRRSIELGLAQRQNIGVLRLELGRSVVGRVLIAAPSSDEIPSPCQRGWVGLLGSDPSGGDRDFVDDRGYVELRGLAAGEYRVQVVCDGLRSLAIYDPLTIDTVGGRPLRAIWWVEPGLSVVGRLVDADDAPVPGVRVSASALAEPAGRAQPTGWSEPTDLSGHFEISGLVEGRYALQPEIHSWTGEATEVTLNSESVPSVRVVYSEAEAEPAPRREPAHRRAPTRGRVLDSQGRPVSGALIVREDEFLPKYSGHSAFGWTEVPTTSDAEGRFQIERINFVEGDGLLAFVRGGSESVQIVLDAGTDKDAGNRVGVQFSSEKVR